VGKHFLHAGTVRGAIEGSEVIGEGLHGPGLLSGGDGRERGSREIYPPARQPKTANVHDS